MLISKSIRHVTSTERVFGPAYLSQPTLDPELMKALVLDPMATLVAGGGRDI